MYPDLCNDHQSGCMSSMGEAMVGRAASACRWSKVGTHHAERELAIQNRWQVKVIACLCRTGFFLSFQKVNPRRRTRDEQ